MNIFICGQDLKIKKELFGILRRSAITYQLSLAPLEELLTACLKRNTRVLVDIHRAFVSGGSFSKDNILDLSKARFDDCARYSAIEYLIHSLGLNDPQFTQNQPLALPTSAVFSFGSQKAFSINPEAVGFREFFQRNSENGGFSSFSYEAWQQYFMVVNDNMNFAATVINPGTLFATDTHWVDFFVALEPHAQMWELMSDVIQTAIESSNRDHQDALFIVQATPENKEAYQNAFTALGLGSNVIYTDALPMDKLQHDAPRFFDDLVSDLAKRMKAEANGLALDHLSGIIDIRGGLTAAIVESSLNSVGQLEKAQAARETTKEQP